jgi:multidrug resistance efflux pump
MADHSKIEAEIENVEQAPAAEPAEPGPDKIRKLTRWTLWFVIAFFIWYLLADRFTPSTSQARVRGFIVQIVPQVSGLITAVEVGINEEVNNGQVLVRIDPSDYELALQGAEAELELAGQDVGASTAAVGSAQGSLSNARANLRKMEIDANRLFAVEDKGVIPQADIDRARGLLEQAKAQVITAESELTRARESLGDAGVTNPRILKAVAELEQAQLDLDRTVLRAPSSGGVTNIRLDAGHYAQSGTPLMTFVAEDAVWLEAYLRENNLGNIEAGDEVEIVLDVVPGQVFQGKVASIGLGVQTGKDTGIGVLPTISGPTGWLRDPQRFPVIIEFTDAASAGFRREGGQADVIVYTSGNVVLNMLGWIQIRLIALLSYLY